jgi:hypothetical protein
MKEDTKILNCKTCQKNFHRDLYDVGRDFCSLACAYWQHVDPSVEGCWIWPSKKSHGYGVVKWKGKFFAAHRVCYAAMNGVSEFKSLFNMCGNILCSRGDHWTTDSSWKWTYSERYRGKK